MNTIQTLIIKNGVIGINVWHELNSLADVNELINALVEAKNTAFPSGFEEHKRKMEVLNGNAKDKTQDG